MSTNTETQPNMAALTTGGQVETLPNPSEKESFPKLVYSAAMLLVQKLTEIPGTLQKYTNEAVSSSFIKVEGMVSLVLQRDFNLPRTVNIPELSPRAWVIAKKAGIESTLERATSVVQNMYAVRLALTIQDTVNMWYLAQNRRSYVTKMRKVDCREYNEAVLCPSLKEAFLYAAAIRLKGKSEAVAFRFLRGQLLAKQEAAIAEAENYADQHLWDNGLPRLVITADLFGEEARFEQRLKVALLEGQSIQLDPSLSSEMESTIAERVIQIAQECGLAEGETIKYVPRDTVTPFTQHRISRELGSISAIQAEHIKEGIHDAFLTLRDNLRELRSTIRQVRRANLTREDKFYIVRQILELAGAPTEVIETILNITRSRSLEGTDITPQDYRNLGELVLEAYKTLHIADRRMALEFVHFLAEAASTDKESLRTLLEYFKANGVRTATLHRVFGPLRTLGRFGLYLWGAFSGRYLQVPNAFEDPHKFLKLMINDRIREVEMLGLMALGISGFNSLVFHNSFVETLRFTLPLIPLSVVANAYPFLNKFPFSISKPNFKNAPGFLWILGDAFRWLGEKMPEGAGLGFFPPAISVEKKVPCLERKVALEDVGLPSVFVTAKPISAIVLSTAEDANIWMAPDLFGGIAELGTSRWRSRLYGYQLKTKSVTEFVIPAVVPGLTMLIRFLPNTHQRVILDNGTITYVPREKNRLARAIDLHFRRLNEWYMEHGAWASVPWEKGLHGISSGTGDLTFKDKLRFWLADLRFAINPFTPIEHIHQASDTHPVGSISSINDHNNPIPKSFRRSPLELILDTGNAAVGIFLNYTVINNFGPAKAFVQFLHEHVFSGLPLVDLVPSIGIPLKGNILGQILDKGFNLYFYPIRWCLEKYQDASVAQQFQPIATEMLELVGDVLGNVTKGVLDFVMRGPGADTTGINPTAIPAQVPTGQTPLPAQNLVGDIAQGSPFGNAIIEKLCGGIPDCFVDGKLNQSLFSEVYHLADGTLKVIFNGIEYVVQP